MKSMKNLIVLIISIFSVSLVSAQGYVDDLYYNGKKSKAEREAEQARQKAKQASDKAERDARRLAEAKQHTEKSNNEDDYTTEEVEYYPGMFSDMLNGTRQINSQNAEKDKKSESKVSFQIVGLWTPSWYGYSSWGSPFYNPWYGSSFFYDPFDPFYSYGWGYNHWGYSHHYYSRYYPYYGWGHGPSWGWYGPHYPHGGYYSPPRYNSYNSRISNNRRDGSTMVGSTGRRSGSVGTSSQSRRGGNSSMTNSLRRMDNRTNNIGVGSGTTTDRRGTVNSSQPVRRDVTTNNRGNNTTIDRRGGTNSSQPVRRETTTQTRPTNSGSGTIDRRGTNSSGGGTVVNSTRRR